MGEQTYVSIRRNGYLYLSGVCGGEAGFHVEDEITSGNQDES